ncbi:tRNA (cytosine(34)-C(5))-methyltransferase-like isoform X1 [Cucurbita maxima]|uniref:tRNA (Cytosine(34)-C(5))-methyltransferase-like isoform X1 n=1 Tax=Cucurbita maxima TaxID=3661 RepID=A0A6J1IQ20_CUCMA|nr:tRNA (cytosine(34)-C(5))-methyltransferase-like isoform X1 [Cucurbita maxima]
MGGKGRGGRARTQRNHFRESRENVWKRSKPDSNSANDTKDGNSNHWGPFQSQSHAFNEYYKEQGIVTAEEWDTFIEVLRKQLPAAFRINSSGQFCGEIRAQLQNDFMKSLQSEVTDGDEAGAIRPLSWYPDNLAWHSNFSRMQLRKNQALERFHEFLKLENEIGNITRQEAVSMVPPLFLDVHPNHYVLDMCAAPGSKTFQLLEIIHQSSKPGDLPGGLVVANDSDVQRCNLLIHQTKRMCTSNLIVTNHEAQHFPGCRAHTNFFNASAAGSELNSHNTQLTFDRVLCDVPCSGDGTLRKAPDIWRRWNSGVGNGLHGLQVQIGMRGASLLKVGGRMVYSTCSMNPVENEAVVAELLRKSEGSLEVVDVSNELPQLVRRPGLKKWKVRDRGVWLASYKQVSDHRQSVAIPSMFPFGRGRKNQADKSHNSELRGNHLNGSIGSSVDVSEPTMDPVHEFDEVCEFPIERCMRIVPHDQNSGAFFIAVLRKVAPLPAATEKPSYHNLKPANDKSRCKLPQNITNGANVDVSASVGMDESPSEVGIDSNNQGDFNSADNKPACEFPVQDIEGKEGLDSNAADGIDKQFSEADLEVNLIDNEVNVNNLEITAIEDNLEESKQPDDGEMDPKKSTVKRKLQIQGKWKGVDPVVLFKDETVIDSIKTFYGINEAFPLFGHLVTRNTDTNHVKRIYYVSKSVKDVLELNFSVGQQLKITSIGLKMFERQSSREGSSAPCSFRITSEGLPVILPYITKQILTMSPVDFKHLIQHKSIKYADFADAAFGEKASSLMLGCCVIVLGTGGNTSSDVIKVDESTIAIGCWKGRSSLSVMVTAIDCQELLERLSNRLGNDV